MKETQTIEIAKTTAQKTSVGVEPLVTHFSDSLYQTPLWCCEYMVSLLPSGLVDILEPSPGQGNLVKTIQKHGYKVTAPDRFEDLEYRKFDAVVMNPPYNKGIEYKFLYDCMTMSDCIIALMPWNTIINADRRTDKLVKWGIRSVTRLPRSTFPGIRTQVCILEMRKGHCGPTKLKLTVSSFEREIRRFF